jgi:hypothetical protein
MVLNENADIRTNPASAVQLAIPPDHTITVDRLTTVKLLQAVVDKGVVKTEVGMMYGRTRYTVEAGGRAHESSIVTPSATQAVRGTDFIAFDQRPFAARGISFQNRVEFRDFKKRVFIGSPRGGKTVVTTEDPNAQSFALNQAVTDPGARLARTAPEQQLVNTLLSSGATHSYDYERGIRVIRGGKVPQTDQELIPTLPGALNFVLRWQGNTDLNLAVLAVNSADNSTEQLYPIAGLDQTRTRGRIPFDHRGGKNGGVEVAFWPAGFPIGTFQIGSVLVSGPSTAARVDVFRDGQRVDIVNPNTGESTPTLSYTATAIPPAIANGQAVGFVRTDEPAGAAVPASNGGKGSKPTVAQLRAGPAIRPPVAPKR